MRVVCSGSNGFIGRHLAGALLDRGDEVVGLDSLTYAADPEANVGRSGFTLVRGDVARPDPAFADRLGRVDAILHLAAESHVDNSIEGQAARFADTNVRGTVNMLDLARRLGCRFLYMSTDEVTGDREGKGPADESSHISASSPYSASKAAGELLTRAYHRTYGLDVVIVRPANCYGCAQQPEKLIPRAITYGLCDRPIPLYGDGRQARDWLHVSDCARGTLAALDRGRAGQVHCLSARHVRENREVVDAIARATRAIIERVTDRPGHDRRYEQDPSKAERELGWRANVAFDTGLAETIAWYKSDEGRTWTEKAKARGGRW